MQTNNKNIKSSSNKHWIDVIHGSSSKLAWVILAISLIITLIAWSISNNYADQLAKDRFEFLIADAQDAISKRFLNYEQVLSGGLGLFKASTHVNRKEWKIYIDTLGIDKNFPGTLGIGYSKWLKPNQLNNHIKEIRQEGFSDFSVRPAGRRDHYSSIIFLEPFNERNQRAFGYDMFSESVRRTAMERARDTGKAAISGKVTLVQETNKGVQAGFLIYVPHYRYEVNTLKDKQKALAGYVYSALRVGDLMHGILGVGLPELDFTIFDGESSSTENQLYNSSDEISAHLKHKSKYILNKKLDIGGHVWTISYRSNPTFDILTSSNQSTLVAVGGVVIDLLLFYIILVLVRLRSNAETVADERKSEYKAIADTANDGIISVDKDGEIVYVNKLVKYIFGYSRDKLIGNSIAILFSYSSKSNVMEVFKQEGKSDNLLNNRLFEFNAISYNGDVFPVEFSLSRWETKNTIRFTVVVRDITERKKMEESLRSSKQHLNLYRDQTPLAAIEWNTDFQVINWNNAANKMFGYTLDEVKGRDFVNFMLPDDAVSDVEQVWAELIAGNGGTKSINKNLTKDGRVILCEWHNSPIEDKSGIIIGASSLVLDVTKQYKAQQDLLRKEQEQRDTLNSLIDSVITIDETGKVITFNKASEKLFGFDSEEIVGLNVNLLMPEFYAINHDGYLKSYIDSGVSKIIGKGREVEGKRKDNSVFKMSLSVAELPLSENGLRHFVGSCMDLTSSKAQEEQLRRSQKMDALGKLTGGIAHDYNNMLGVILGYSEILESSLSEQPDLAKFASQIYYAGTRGAELTRKLLSFSKGDTSSEDIVNINESLGQQQLILEKTLTARIKLHLELENSLWPVLIDGNDLDDAILNMSINAMHAINNNGVLTIKTYNVNVTEPIEASSTIEIGDYVALSITDSGSGMSSETLQNVFDPFFSTKGKDGTGLGLSQVYGFIERSHGAVNISSELGEGTQILLYFPRHIELGEESDVTEVINDIVVLGTETILLVDDEPALLSLNREVLLQQGYKVLTAESAPDALNLLKSNSIDLVISDVIMPEQDGYQLAKLIQKGYPDVKIQLVSGFSDQRHLNMDSDELYKNLLHKPLNSYDLLKRIRMLLDGS